MCDVHLARVTTLATITSGCIVMLCFCYGSLLFHTELFCLFVCCCFFVLDIFLKLLGFARNGGGIIVLSIQSHIMVSFMYKQYRFISQMCVWTTPKNTKRMKNLKCLSQCMIHGANIYWKTLVIVKVCFRLEPLALVYKNPHDFFSKEIVLDTSMVTCSKWKINWIRLSNEIKKTKFRCSNILVCQVWFFNGIWRLFLAVLIEIACITWMSQSLRLALQFSMDLQHLVVLFTKAFSK